MERKLKRANRETINNLQTGFCNLHGLDVTPEGEQNGKFILQSFQDLNGPLLAQVKEAPFKFATLLLRAPTRRILLTSIQTARESLQHPFRAVVLAFNGQDWQQESNSSDDTTNVPSDDVLKNAAEVHLYYVKQYK